MEYELFGLGHTVYSGKTLPHYKNEGDSGFDLRAAIAEPFTLRPVWEMGQFGVPLGIGVAMSPGLELQIRPRSGLAAKYGLTVVNSPGTIDASFRGEIMAILALMGTEPLTIEPGMRIVQGVVAPVENVSLEQGSLDDTERGASGLGGTGTD